MSVLSVLPDLSLLETQHEGVYLYTRRDNAKVPSLASRYVLEYVSYVVSDMTISHMT